MKNWLFGTFIAFAALALFTNIGANNTELNFPPIGNFAEIAGLRVHYHEAGSGPAIVLIHGASTNLRDFYASIFQPLSKKHRVIAIDRPGHGYSDRPSGDWPNPAEQAQLIRDVLRKLDVEDPLLVGHSWSGSVVLAYLLTYPQDAIGGVLLAGGSHPWEGGVAWYNDLAALPIVGELFAWTLAYPFGLLELDTAVRQVFFPNAVPKDYTEQTGVRLSLWPKAFLANAEDVRLLSDFLKVQSRRYADIKHPLLLMTGDADDIVPAWNHADRLIQQAANAEIVVLENTGHALHHTHPTRIAGFIEGFSGRLRVVARHESDSLGGQTARLQ